MNKEEFIDKSRTYIEVRGDHYEHVDTINKTMIGRANNVFTGLEQRKQRMSPPKALAQVMKQMIDDGMICQPADVCLIFKLDQEIPCMGFVSMQDFISRIPKVVPELQGSELMPNTAHFKSINFGSNNYPQWPWDGFAQRTLPHVRAVCDNFLDAMAALGFVHPSLR